MIKQLSSDGGKILIFLIGLVFLALLAIGVVWSTQFMQNDKPAAPAAKRMKIAQAPATKRMKIPQAPPLPAPQPTTETTRSQPIAEATTMTSVPKETPPHISTEPQPVVSQTQSTQAEAPADKSATDEHNSTPPSLPSPVTAEAPAPQAETPEVVAAKETPNPTTAPAEDEPADGTTAQEEIGEVQPKEDSSADMADKVPSQPEADQPEAATADTDAVRFNLQVGAYRVEDYARDAMTKLSERGYDPFIFQISDSRERTWYTVRIGRYENREAATASLDRLKQKENITAVIARSGKL